MGSLIIGSRWRLVSIFAVLFLAYVFASPSSASAAPCPEDHNRWGNRTGSSAGLAGLVVEAQIARLDGSTGRINTSFNVRSGGSSPGLWHAPNGVPGTKQSSGDFSTGTQVYRQGGSNNPCEVGGVYMFGYGNTGSGSTGNWGTGWVLDCHDSNNNVMPFTITVTGGNPTPYGHWYTAMRIDDGPYSHTDGAARNFTLANGSKAWIFLFWQEAAAPPDDGGGGGEYDTGLGISVNGYSGSVTMSLANSSDGGPHDVGDCTNRANGVNSFSVSGYKECFGHRIGPIGIEASNVSNYRFVGWSGCDNSSGRTCYVELYESGWKYITAIYEINDQYYPSFSISATCDTITISNLTDGDNGGSIPITIYVDDTQIHSRNARGTFSIPLPTQYQEDAQSHTISARATSITANGSSNSAMRTTQSQSLAACYRASCTITDPTSASALDVKQGFDATANIRNDGYYNWNTSSGNRRITTRLNYNGHTSSPTVPATTAGQTASNIRYTGFTVVNSINQQTLTVEVLLDGSKNIGSCSTSFDPYAPFVITPIASTTKLYQGSNPDPERPDEVWFLNSATVAYGDGSVGGIPSDFTFSGDGIVMSRQIVKTAYPSGANSTISGSAAYEGGADSTSFATPASTMKVKISSFNIGDKYCGKLNLTYSVGRVNRVKRVLDARTPTSADAGCDTVLARPIFRVYGGDVAAGFKDCKGWSSTDHTGDIISWVKNAADPTLGGAGSGTQLAAISRGTVRDFASSIGKGPGTFGPPSLLRFATTGNFGTAACPYDYWAGASGGAATMKDVSPSGTFKHVGDYTIGEAAIDLPQHGALTGARTVYVDGDVFITDNLTFSSLPWTFSSTSTTIPSLTLVAHGNIYIHHSVTNLDGLYVAQPKYNNSTSTWEKGEIRTCVADSSGTLPAVGTYFETCKSNLMVNGAFISNIVRMQRTKGTRYDSANGDNVSAAQGNSGEVFLFSPELWLRAANLNTNGNTKHFDSITSGAPVL